MAHHGAADVMGLRWMFRLVQATIPVVLERIKQELGEARFAASKFTAAGKLFDQMTAAKEMPEFLTSIATRRLIDAG